MTSAGARNDRRRGRRPSDPPGSGGIVLLVLVASMWGIEGVDQLFGLGLDRYGILPRTLSGLIGVPAAPFLHGGFGHLLSNTPPLLILGWLVSLRGRAAFITITAQIAVLGGIAVWAFGRGGAVHIGASGLVFGFFGFVVGAALFERRVGSIVAAVIALLFYAGLVWGVLPTQPGVSWEGHLYGLAAGLFVARQQSLGARP